MKRKLLAVVAVAAGLAIGGCAQQRSESTTRPDAGAASMVNAACRAQSVFEQDQRAVSFAPTAGESKQRMVKSLTGDAGGLRELRTRIDESGDHAGDAAGDDGDVTLPGARPVRTERLRFDTGGALVMESNIDHPAQVESVFEPPLVVLPGELVRGMSAEQDLRMIAYKRGNRTEVRAKGPVHNQIQYVADEEVQVAGQRLTARHIRSVFTADLSGTKVRNQTDQWFVDDVGLVAESRSERTTFMGMPVREGDESWVRESMP